MLTCEKCKLAMFASHAECRKQWRVLNVAPRVRRKGTKVCIKCHKAICSENRTQRKIQADANYLAGAARKNAIAKLKQCDDLKVLKIASEIAEGERKELIDKRKRKVECLKRPQT